MDAAVEMTKQGVRNLNGLGRKKAQDNVDADDGGRGERAGQAIEAAPQSVPEATPVDTAVLT
jgi:hypothetical protein